jgi:hypothetical protein
LAAAGCTNHPVSYDTPAAKSAAGASVYGIAPAPALPSRSSINLQLAGADKLNGNVIALGLMCSSGTYPNDLRVPVTRYLSALDADGNLAGGGGVTVTVSSATSTLRCFHSGEMAFRCTGAVEITADTSALGAATQRVVARAEQANQSGSCATFTKALARLGEHAASDLASQVARLTGGATGDTSATR